MCFKMCFKLFIQKLFLALKKLSAKNNSKQLLLNFVTLVLLTVTLSTTQLANTVDTDHRHSTTKESLFPFGHHADHVATVAKITHDATTPNIGPTSSRKFDILDMGMSTGAGLGAGYFMSKNNPRTALLLTATSFAAIMGTGAFLDHYRTEVRHLKTGFKEISEIKQAQATQAQLLTTAHHNVGASKALIETTFGVTAATTKQLQDLAEQSALNQQDMLKLDTSIQTTNQAVAEILAKTQANLVSKIKAQDQALTDGQTTSDGLFKRVFGLDLNKLFKTRTETNANDTSPSDRTTPDSKPSERSMFDSYSERWD